MKKLKILLTSLILIVLITGCKGLRNTDTTEGSNITTTKNIESTSQIITEPPIIEQTTEKKSQATQEITTETTTEITIEEITEPATEKVYGIQDNVIVKGMAQDILNNMSIEEKIGQLFIVNFEALDSSKGAIYEFKEINEKIIRSIHKYHVGGVVFFARNIETIDQTKNFVNTLQEYSKIPLFISVDEEGGKVSRIGNNTNMSTTAFESMESIGNTNDPQLAYNAGDIIGSEIKELGFNLNFAPIADVKSSNKAFIGERSFGSDPKVVSQMVPKFVEGLQKNGVSATLKHFIGLGIPEEDFHENSINISKTVAEYRKTDFLPFESGIKAQVDMIMVSHSFNIGITENKVPTSMSKLMLTDILRKELGFEGIIITDVMNIKPLTEVYTSKKASVEAIKAGVDILLMPQDLEDSYNALLDYVKEGKITEERINESVLRILEVKLKRGVIGEDTKLINNIESLNN